MVGDTVGVCEGRNDCEGCPGGMNAVSVGETNTADGNTSSVTVGAGVFVASGVNVERPGSVPRYIKRKGVDVPMI